MSKNLLRSNTVNRLFDILGKLELPNQYLQFWSEIIGKKSIIRQNIEYSLQNLIKSKNEILGQLSELDSCAFNLFISKIEDNALLVFLKQLDDNKHHVMLEELKFLYPVSI